MSTIFDALQKSKLNPAGSPPANIPKNQTTPPWKVFFSFALLVIMVLLSILIYLLINPRPAPSSSNDSQFMSAINQDVTDQALISKSPTNDHVLSNAAITSVNEESALVKVNFDTKPLHVISPKVQVTQKQQRQTLPDNIAEPVTATVGNSKAENEPLLISHEPKPKTPIDDSQDAPSDLERRFELAVLLNEIEENEQSDQDKTQLMQQKEEPIRDSSDIRQMSSDFQNKVPLIRYDAHMYSSVASDRWIRINGEKLTEGQFDNAGQLELLEIQPQRSIFRLQRQSFSVEALEDWKGY